MAKQLVKKALVTVLVHGGPKDGFYTNRTARVLVGNMPTYFKGKTLTLGQWVELYGNGKSRRTLEVAYDDIPRMVEFLVEAWARHQQALVTPPTTPLKMVPKVGA